MKKPHIKIVYPDASEIAMLLTEAMVRRASGKRVVETESAEREHTGLDLFAGSLCCVTETSVELTLNLAPEAMDFAPPRMLIAKNLTSSERDKAMSASESLELDALFSRAQAAEAGAGTCTDEVRSAPLADGEAATQSGEAEAEAMRQEPTWDDVEREARSMGKNKADRADKADKAEAEQDSEIEPGLLNDVDETYGKEEEP